MSAPAEAGSPGPDDRLRRGLAIGGALIGLWIPIHFFILGLLHRYYPGDFKLFWQIARLPSAQVWGDYPFSYLPSGLLLLEPFGWPPLLFAYLAFTALALTLWTWAGRRLVPARTVALSLLTGGVLGTLAGGHVTLILFALVLAGLAEERPAPAGLMLAAAAMLKPQTVLALPLVLMALGRWRTIAWTALGCGLIVALSVACFGADSWTRWLDNIHRFPTYLTSRQVDLEDRGLYGLFRSLDLPGSLYLLGVPLGLACATLGARGAADPIERVMAMLAGTVLLVPYTMPYDLAGLSLVAVHLLRQRTADPLLWGAAALVLTNYLAAIGVLVLAYRLVAQARGGPRLVPAR